MPDEGADDRRVITGVDFVSIPTDDLERAMVFYGDVLGLERSSTWQRPGHDPVGAEYETGTVTLALIDCAALGITFRPNCVPIALRVEDVAAARAELEHRGVAFLAATMDTGVCHKAHLRDPAGNVIELHHRYAPRG